MIWTLVKKDFIRVRHNPWGLLVSLSIPLLVTALIGFAFGPKSGGGGVPLIRVAVVDEDQSVLGGLLMGALDREVDGKRYFHPIPAGRAEADTLILNDEISAILILPPGFSEDFLSGARPAPIELIKNPAQSFLPVIFEELVSVLVTFLDAASRNLSGELAGFVQQLDEGQMPDFMLISGSIERVGRKLAVAEDILFPPLIRFEQELRGSSEGAESGSGGGGGGGVGIFGYILPGLAAMFLLFVADGVAQEIYRERELKTLDRIRVFHRSVVPFLVSKGVHGILLLGLSGAILFWGGGFLFGIDWRHPFLIAVLIFSYCLFGVGFVSLIAALMRTQKRAALLNNMVILLMAFLGGSLIPASEMPRAIREFVAPCFPNYWFAEAVKGLEYSVSGPDWAWAAGGLALVGALLLAGAAVAFNRLLQTGGGGR